MCNLFFSILSFSILLQIKINAQTPTSTTSFYVSPNGNDKNVGSFSEPFATIGQAKEAIVRLKKKNGLPNGGIIVYLRGGIYSINKAISFNAADAGEENKPIIYQAFKNEKVRINGNVQIAANKWQPLSDDARKRVSPHVDATKLVELDVASLGLVNVKSFAPSNKFSTDWFIVDLFANGKRQPISQWPNPNENIRNKNEVGFTTCNGTKDNLSFFYAGGGKPQDNDTVNEIDLDGTNRAYRWQTSLNNGHELWLKGLWRTPWEPFTHKVSEINTQKHYIQFFASPNGGMGSKYAPKANENPVWTFGSGRENWFAINYLDEIDQPGEWALDFKDHKIYYYPPAPVKTLQIEIADMKDQPLVFINNAAYLQIINIGFEGGLNNAMKIINGNHLLIAGCNFTNVGYNGISMTGGSNNTIQSNNFNEIGGYGIELIDIGNRKTLTSGNTQLVNNHIHHVGKLVFKQAISISKCVGITVAHNLLHDIPTAAIRTDDINNCLLEYNEIHNIAQKESDNGVFYSYGGWSTYGNVFRYNFSHHTNRSNGCYSDDGTSGNVYTKNIVQGCIGGVVFGGGHDNLAENNLFVESKSQAIDDRGIARNYRIGTKYETRLTDFRVNEEPWKSYGQKLKQEFNLTTNLWDDVLNPDWHPEFPNGCRIANNVGVASGKFKSPKNGAVNVSNNTVINTLADAQFFDYAKMDLRSNNPDILAKFPELNTVFPIIGLQKDSYRPTVPTRAETGGLTNHGVDGDLKNEDQFIDVVKPK